MALSPFPFTGALPIKLVVAGTDDTAETGGMADMGDIAMTGTAGAVATGGAGSASAYMGDETSQHQCTNSVHP